jgi:4-amino-4-deoxy-L-arabinose transferase-like glycosyltransferase
LCRWPWLAALLLVSLPLLLYRLGAKDFWEASEGRPAESAREMAAQGDWLVQYTNGDVDLTKPPLYAWLTGLSFHLFGESEGAARLPSVLATLGILALTFLLGARLAGPRAGFLAGLVLLTQARFLWQARLAELETLLALGVLASYVALGSALERPPGRERTARFAAGWVALGFAFAVKGPIAFLLVLPGVLGFAIWTKRMPALRSPAALLTFPLALVVGLAWYVAVVQRDPSALDTFVSYGRGENVGHLRDPFYYLWQYLLAVLPWTPLVLLGFFLPRAPDLDAVTRDRARFCMAAFGVTFFALSILHQKQTHYLIPIFPFGAVLAGATLERAATRAGSWTHRVFLLCAVLVLLCALALAAWPKLGKDLGGWPSLPIVVGVALGVALLSAWAARRALQGALHSAALVLVASTALLEGFVAGHVAPAQNRALSPRAFLERAAARVPPFAPLASSVFGSHSEHLWYLGRTVNLAQDLEALQRWFELPGVRYALVHSAQAEALSDVVLVLDRDPAFQKKDRSVALVVGRAPEVRAGSR